MVLFAMPDVRTFWRVASSRGIRAGAVLTAFANAIGIVYF